MATSQTKTKDHYAILGVDRKADAKAIKSAFRKLARKYHPDVNPGDAASEERFKDINEAFNVLSEGPSRKLYDRYGVDWERYRDAGFTGDEPASSSFNGFPASPGTAGRPSTFTYETGGDAGGFTDFVQSMFGNRRGASDRYAPPQQRRRRGDDLDVAIELGLDDAFNGTSRRIDIQTPVTCQTCGGTGFARQAPCPTCDATGFVDKAKSIEVKVPAGVATGSRIRVTGQGGPGFGGGPSGDVWLNVTVRPDKRFERAGDDLKTEVDVPLYTAVLGGEIVVPTPTRRVALAVPAGSQSGRQFRLRGQGMPRLKSKAGERGDLLARIRIEIPEDLTEQERSLFEQLRSLRSDS